MIRSELVAKLASKINHIPENALNESISYLLEKMCITLSQGERIEIRGFGSFSLHFRPPRNAHNPKNGTRLITKPKYTPHFKPGKEMRDRINESAAVTSIKEALEEEDTD